MKLKTAIERAKSNVVTMFDENCCIYEYENRKDGDTGISGIVKILVEESLPCKRSYKSSPAAERGNECSGIKQNVILFVSPQTVVKEGSMVVVTDKYGMQQEYEYSGCSKNYNTHNEVELSLKRKWA